MNRSVESMTLREKWRFLWTRQNEITEMRIDSVTLLKSGGVSIDGRILETQPIGFVRKLAYVSGLRRYV